MPTRSAKAAVEAPALSKPDEPASEKPAEDAAPAGEGAPEEAAVVDPRLPGAMGVADGGVTKKRSTKKCVCNLAWCRKSVDKDAHSLQTLPEHRRRVILKDLLLRGEQEEKIDAKLKKPQAWRIHTSHFHFRDKKRETRRGKLVWILKDPAKAWPDATSCGPIGEGDMEGDMGTVAGENIVAGDETGGAEAMVGGNRVPTAEKTAQDLLADYDAFELPSSMAESLLSPSLVIRMDKVRQNAELMTELVRNPLRWRFQTKESKAPSVWAEAIKCGITRFQCATTREVAMLSELLKTNGVAGADVLFAYPAKGVHLRRMMELAGSYPDIHFSVLCEEIGDVSAIPENLGIFVEINIYADRTGVTVSDEDRIMEIAKAANDAKHFRGLHCYEGPDLEKSLSTRATKLVPWYGRLVSLQKKLRQEAGIEGAEIITSGGFQAAFEYEDFAQLGAGVHQVAPEYALLYDMSSWGQYAGAGFSPSALVCARVSSKPGENVFAVDVGSSGIVTTGKNPVAGIIGNPDIKAYKSTGDYTVFHVLQGKAPENGSVQYLIPGSISGTANLHEFAVLAEGNDVTQIEQMARGYELCLDGDRATFFQV